MNVFSFNMSRHTLVGSLGVIIFRSCDQEVKKKHIGDKREDDGGKGNAFDEENE